MTPKTEYSDPNARPCFLHGCQTDVHADGSSVCRVCGVWRGPDLAMVNALLKANAGGVTYRNQAAALRMIPPLAPKPIPPPILKGTDGSHLEPVLTLPLLTIGAAIVGALSFIAAVAGVHLADWMSK